MTVTSCIELERLRKNQNLTKIDGMNVQKEYTSLSIGKKPLIIKSGCKDDRINRVHEDVRNEYKRNGAGQVHEDIEDS